MFENPVAKRTAIAAAIGAAGDRSPLEEAGMIFVLVAANANGAAINASTSTMVTDAK